MACVMGGLPRKDDPLLAGIWDSRGGLLLAGGGGDEEDGDLSSRHDPDPSSIGVLRGSGPDLKPVRLWACSGCASACSIPCVVRETGAWSLVSPLGSGPSIGFRKLRVLVLS